MTEPEPSPTVEQVQAAYVRPAVKRGRPPVEGGRESVTLRLRRPLLDFARAESQRRGWPLAHYLDLLLSRAVIASPQDRRTEEQTATAFELYDADAARMQGTRARRGARNRTERADGTDEE